MMIFFGGPGIIRYEQLVDNARYIRVALDANYFVIGREARNATHGVAEIYVGLGKYEHALDWLEEHPDAYDFIKVWLPFKSLHSEPRFHQRLKYMKLDKRFGVNDTGDFVALSADMEQSK